MAKAKGLRLLGFKEGKATGVEGHQYELHHEDGIGYGVHVQHPEGGSAHLGYWPNEDGAMKAANMHNIKQYVGGVERQDAPREQRPWSQPWAQSFEHPEEN